MVEQIGVEPCVTEDGMKKYVNDVLQKIKADKNKISMVNFLFGRKNKKSRWKIDFYDSIYKIYDKDGNLAEYFFSNYPKIRQIKIVRH